MTTLPSYAMNQSGFPAMYERHLAGPLFRPWAEPTLEEARLSPSESLLDIACGTGVVARAARERLGPAGRIVGVDVSPDMLVVARAVQPDIDWREGNAGALPLEADERFDVVVCQQGVQFFPDKPRAAAEMRRALAPGGRLAVAAWRSDDEMPFLRELRAVAERRLGAVEDQRYGFGDAGALEALLRGAGFEDVRVQTLSRTIVFEEGVHFLRLNAMALVGMSAAAKTMSEAERQRTVEAIATESPPQLGAHSDGSKLAFELKTNLATARI